MDPYATSWSVQILNKSTAQVVEAGNRSRMEREKQRQRSSRLFAGQNLFNSLPRYCCFCLGLFGRKGWIHPQMNAGPCGSGQPIWMQRMSYLGPPPPRNNHWTSRKKRFVLMREKGFLIKRYCRLPEVLSSHFSSWMVSHTGMSSSTWRII